MFFLSAIYQGKIFRRVTVRPAVNGNANDVARWIEATRPQDPAKLGADLVFKGFERRGQKLGAPGLVLFAFGQARFGGSAQHVDQHGRRGITWTLIAPDIHWLIQMDG